MTETSMKADTEAAGKTGIKATLSKKARQRAKTKTKLHDVIKAKPTGLGKAIATGFRVGPGKGHIWDAAASPPDDVIALRAVTLSRSPFPLLSSQQSFLMERLRSLKYRQLRKKLISLSVSETNRSLQPPIFAIERWQARCILRETQAELVSAASQPQTLSQPPIPRDPLLPSVLCTDPGLVQDFERASYPPQEANSIATALSAASHSSVTAIADYAATLCGPVNPDNNKQKANRRKRTGGGGGRKSQVKVVKHKHSIDFLAALTSAPDQAHSGPSGKVKAKATRGEQEDSKGIKLYKLNHGHYAKLLQLYRQNRLPNAAGIHCEQHAVEGDDADVDMDSFHERVFVLLARYHSLLGHGFQAALNEHSFQVLKEHFEVSFECFASPLNATFGHFCSAFPDTDRFFGSYGSFFHFRPLSGSFEANPPFIAEVMAAMVDHMHDLLAAATGPMSFIVIVPGWQEDAAWQALEGSSWRRALYLVAESDHGFCDGAQHQRQDRYRESPYDTGVFVLQNEAGAKKWPPTKQVERDLRVAMAHAVPTPQMVQRRLREGRGLADQDGGGGVYKGKKSTRRPGPDDIKTSNSNPDNNSPDNNSSKRKRKRVSAPAGRCDESHVAEKPFFKKKKQKSRKK